MKRDDVMQVYKAIRKHGDSFWNDYDPTWADWNGTLFMDILSYLHKEGLDLQVVPLITPTEIFEIEPELL